MIHTRDLLAELAALVVAVLLVAGALLVVEAVALITWSTWVFFSNVFLFVPPLAILFGAAGIPLFTLDVRALRHVRRTGGVPPTAQWIPPAQAIKIRRLVAELAKRMQTAEPTHLWFTPDANAAVYEARRILPRPRRTRHLCIGVPLLMALTTDQLRAVLSHEMAHYARRHAPFSTKVYRGSAMLRRVLAEIDQAMLPTSDVPTVDKLLRVTARIQRFLFRQYERLYNLVTLAIRRRHEYEADRIAATVLAEDPDDGRRLMAEALRTAADLSILWDLYCCKTLHTPTPVPAPEELYRNFAAVITDPDRLQEWKDEISRGFLPLRDHHADSPGWQGCAHTTSSSQEHPQSHPPLHARLEALGHSDLTPLAVSEGAGRAAVLVEDEHDLLTSVAWTAIENHRPAEHAEEADTEPNAARAPWLLSLPVLNMLTFGLLYMALWLVVSVEAPDLVSTMNVAGFLLLPVVPFVTGVTEPLDHHDDGPQRPWRVRYWLDLTSGLLAGYAALVYFSRMGPYGLPMVVLLLGLAAPLILPNVSSRLPAAYRVIACVFALGTIGPSTP